MTDKQTTFAGFDMSPTVQKRVQARQPKLPPAEPITVEAYEADLLQPNAELTLHLVHNGGRVKPVQFCGFDASFKRALVKPYLDAVRPVCLRTGRLMGGAKARQWRLYEPELKECRSAWVENKKTLEAQAKEDAKRRALGRQRGIG